MAYRGQAPPPSPHGHVNVYAHFIHVCMCAFVHVCMCACVLLSKNAHARVCADVSACRVKENALADLQRERPCHG